MSSGARVVAGTLTRARSCFRNAWQTARAVLREIFDESAYDRFLARQELPHSPANYRRFQHERREGAGRRPRCC